MRFFIYDSIGSLKMILTKAYSARVTQELGKYDSLTADLPNDSAALSAVMNGYYVGVPIKDTIHFELFKLERPSVGPDTITITGVDAAGYDLQTQGAVAQIKTKSISLKEALDLVFAGTNWNYSLLEGKYKNQPLSYETGSKKGLLDKIKEQWGLTTQFIYDVKNNQIEGRACLIGEKFENDTNRKLVRGRDDVNWRYDRDLTSLYSAILPTGDDVEKTTTHTEKIAIDKKAKASKETTTENIPLGTTTITVETDPQAGKKTTTVTNKYIANISSASLSKANGDPLDKTKGTLSITIPELVDKYAWLDSKNKLHPRMIVKKFPGYKDPYKLAIKACNWLIANSRPKVSITATADKIGDVELGDLITVSDPNAGFEMKEPVTKIERNLLADLDSLITIGTYSLKSVAQRLHEQKHKTKKALARHKHAIHKLRKKLKEHDQKLGDLSDKLDGAGAGVMTDTTGRFAMHFDKDTPGKVLTADFNWDSGARLGFNGTQFTMTDDIGGTVASLDHTGLLTAAEIDAGTVKSPQLDGGGKGSLIAHYEEIGQTKSPIGKVYSGEFDPVAVLPDGSVQDDPDNSASFQANHLELNKNVGTYNKQAFLTSDALTLSYPLADGTTGSYGNQKIVLELNNDAVPSVPQLLISQGKNKAVLTPTGLYFNDKNVLEMAGNKTTLPDNLVTSDNLGGALNSLSSAMVNGSKILTEQNLSDMLDDAEQKGAGSYNPLIESLLNLVISHDFMDFICRELDAREYAKLSDINRN